MKKMIFVAVVMAGLSAFAQEASEWNSSTMGLSISGDSAQIEGSCGLITVAKGWNTQGITMTGESCGGPICRNFHPVALKADEVNGKIYLRIQGSGSAIVFDHGQYSPRFRCL